MAHRILARPLGDLFANPSRPRWLLKNELERGVIAVMAGPRGSYKSFIALNWGMRIADEGRPVYVVSAEGGDFDRRAKAWIKHFEIPSTPQLYVVERRLDLSTHDGIQLIRDDCQRLGIKPVLFILDTFSKLSGGLDENSNTDVKAFIGRLDNGLKRAETGFDATVLLVAHTGHSDSGRTRGASALGADTDAEYIVGRKGDVVLVSRQRFKSSPELAPLCYRPVSVELDYADEEGTPITSLIMEESVPTSASGVKYTGKRLLSFEIVQKLLLTGPKPAPMVVRHVADAWPDYQTDGRDRRMHLAKEVIDKFIADKTVILQDGNMLSLYDVVPGTEAEFEGEKQ